MISRIVETIAGADQYVFHLANGVYTTPVLDRVMPALSWSGNLGAIWLVLLGVLAIFGRKTGRRLALIGFGALAIGFFASETIKEITMRPRPFLSLEEVRLLVAAPSSYAFPSGHTTSSFAVASGLFLGARRLLRRVPPWVWGSVVLAAAISYSRLYVGVHWPTDVLAGMALGVASGWVMSRPAVGRFLRRLLQGRLRSRRPVREMEITHKPSTSRGGREILKSVTAEKNLSGAGEAEAHTPGPLEVSTR